MARDGSRPTMRDVADKVGVSKALVSLVFRNAAGPSAETRARVLAAAEELGYRVNRTAALMTARRSHHIGLTINIRNSFHTEIAESIVAAADRAGYEVVLGAVTPTHGEAQVIDTLLDFRCEGLLLLGPELSTEALTTLGKQLPSVVIGRRMRANTLDVVRTADARGIGTVVDHLVGLGHRRVRARLRRARCHRRRSPKRLPACDAQTRLGRSGRCHRGRLHRVRGNHCGTTGACRSADSRGVRQRPPRSRRCRCAASRRS